MGLGVRGMTYDAGRKLVWILAGDSDDDALPKKTPKWKLFTWSGDSGSAPKLIEGYDAYSKFLTDTLLWSPEALTFTKIGGDEVLVLFGDAGDINGKFGPSPYAYFKVANLIRD